MSTHEITAADCTWAEINFESPEKAFKHADKLEQALKDPHISPADKQKIEAHLDDLFSCLFDSMF